MNTDLLRSTSSKTRRGRVCALRVRGAGAAAKDGTFTGTGNGRGGQISSRCRDVQGRKIADVKITKQTLKPSGSDSALRILSGRKLSRSTLKSSTVSGATLTSRGILKP